MNTQDIVDIQQLIALCGHAIDADDQSLIPLVYTNDGVFDPSAMGAPAIEGLDALIAFYTATKPHLPPAHNTTNIHVYEEGGQTRVRSKWMMLSRRDGSWLLGDYDDVVVRTKVGWRIKHRRVKLRHPKAQ